MDQMAFEASLLIPDILDTWCKHVTREALDAGLPGRHRSKAPSRKLLPPTASLTSLGACGGVITAPVHRVLFLVAGLCLCFL